MSVASRVAGGCPFVAERRAVGVGQGALAIRGHDHVHRRLSVGESQKLGECPLDDPPGCRVSRVERSDEVGGSTGPAGGSRVGQHALEAAGLFSSLDRTKIEREIASQTLWKGRQLVDPQRSLEDCAHERARGWCFRCESGDRECRPGKTGHLLHHAWSPPSNPDSLPTTALDLKGHRAHPRTCMVWSATMTAKEADSVAERAHLNVNGT